METYISKPIEVKAELFNPDRIEEYRKMGAEIEIVPTAFGKRYILPTLESEYGRGYVYISEGFYLVCGTKGEFYPCKKDIFEEKYMLEQEYADLEEENKRLEEENKKLKKYYDGDKEELMESCYGLARENDELKKKLNDIQEAYIRFEKLDSQFQKGLGELDQLIMNR